MADTYKDFLATRVLTEGQLVNYRLLSRALKVNVNTAKCMLYEFHTKQNAKKPHSVHATYILTGRKRSLGNGKGTNGVDGRDGEDVHMRSSPPMSSMPELEEEADDEPVPQTVIMLVREEELEATKAQFEDILSEHVYSLNPGPIENLNLLSSCNHEVATEYGADDPLERWRSYGSVHNPYIKRRTSRFAPATASKPTAKPAAKSDKTSLPQVQEAAPARRGSTSEGNTSGRCTPQPTTTASTLKKSEPKSNLKREKSDLFKSFAKAKPKSKDAEKSKESTPAPTDDEPMQGMSEDEGDYDEPEVKIDHEKEAAARKARADREEKLRKMMEEAEDEDMPDAVIADTESQDAPLDKPPTEDVGGTETAVTSQGGRRRGRRKVMKKKTVKDDEGYLVTKEEAVWESFSEDEPALKKPKTAPKPSTAKGKNLKAGKGGQGSIASFFKKA